MRCKPITVKDYFEMQIQKMESDDYDPYFDKFLGLWSHYNEVCLYSQSVLEMVAKYLLELLKRIVDIPVKKNSYVILEANMGDEFGGLCHTVTAFKKSDLKKFSLYNEQELQTQLQSLSTTDEMLKFVEDHPFPSPVVLEIAPWNIVLGMEFGTIIPNGYHFDFYLLNWLADIAAAVLTTITYLGTKAEYTNHHGQIIVNHFCGGRRMIHLDCGPYPRELLTTKQACEKYSDPALDIDENEVGARNQAAPYSLANWITTNIVIREYKQKSFCFPVVIYFDGEEYTDIEKTAKRTYGSSIEQFAQSAIKDKLRNIDK